MGFASFTVLVWDHVDTFAEEVEFIWMGEKGPIGILFLINRYLTPLGFIVNLFAYLSPVWDDERCDRFIRFEGSMTVIGINIVAIMMYLRIRALYHGNRWVLGGVLLLLVVQICMNAWLMTRSQRVFHNPISGVRACTMIFDPSISAIASSSAWLPLLYDTAVLGLTVFRTLPSLKNRKTPYIMKRLFQDGLIYYSAIFAVTLVLTLMIISAPEGLKNITAQLELLLTVAMMSRITINLKKSAKKINGTQIRPEMPSNFTQKSQLDVVPDIDIRIAAPRFANYGTQSEGEFLPMERISRRDPLGRP
ncbi:hypothetical protein D9611_007450 [Ephemerocybe angulata]|uniref:DUF6533 domain-containing protein n=1 Tax=Ephemerocybe angulata TaxID=980116 RepID=A0A8H5CF94_9AGAR|nr:hypothetical protein D9611_007450 [Tulosesus angulatus]